MSDTREIEQDYLALKWGTLKSWKFESEAAKSAAQKYDDAGPQSMSAMMQRDNPEQVEALCGIIDAVNCQHIYNDWSGEAMTKEQAKKYVREYRQ